MSRSGKDRDTRVRTSKKRTASSTRWLQRQLNDPYVKQAKADGYRSRAAYKLIELDEKFSLLNGVTRVVDLGIAPGGWSQVVRKRKPRAHVVGIDLLEVEPIEGVTILQMDFMADDAPRALEEALGGKAELVSHRVEGIELVALLCCGLGLGAVGHDARTCRRPSEVWWDSPWGGPRGYSTSSLRIRV